MFAGGMKYLALLCVLSAAAHADTAKRPPAGPAGKVSGTVIFEGEAPERKPVKRDSDPYCAKSPKLAEDVIVTKGKLKDVFVRIKNPPATTATANLPLIDQKDCTYSPHVFAVPVGGKIAVRNSDGTFHNVNGSLSGKLLWNKPQAAKDPELNLDASGAAGQVIDLVCNVHPWMHAYGVIIDHPFYAVTGEDGAFSIPGLPPGKYTLEAWHPTLGTKSLDFVVGSGAKASAVARISYKTN